MPPDGPFPGQSSHKSNLQAEKYRTYLTIDHAPEGVLRVRVEAVTQFSKQAGGRSHCRVPVGTGPGHPPVMFGGKQPLRHYE